MSGRKKGKCDCDYQGWQRAQDNWRRSSSCARRAVTAVSTLRIRGPMLKDVKFSSLNLPSSKSTQPPSGPMARTVRPLRGKAVTMDFSLRGWAMSRVCHLWVNSGTRSSINGRNREWMDIWGRVVSPACSRPFNRRFW